MVVGEDDKLPDTIDVCLATRLYAPFYAGGALRFKRYLPGLAARGIRPRVFTGTPAQERLKDAEVRATWQMYPPGTCLPVETIDAIQVHRVRLPDAGSRKRIATYGRSLIDFCQQTEYRPDLVQLLPLTYWAVPWLLKLRQIKIPMVMAYNLFENFSHHPVKRAVQRYLWRLPFQIVDGVVVNSNAMRDNLQSLGVTTSTRVIPNGVDIKLFKPVNDYHAKQALRHSLGMNPGDKLIITVGAVEPRKGTDLLLEAWTYLAPEHPNAHLVIVGPRADQTNPAYETFHQRLEKLLSAASTPSRIHFVGRVDHVEKYLQTADIFVFTSLREGFPNVILEAMAAELPVVTTPFIGLPDELGAPNEHFLLVDRNPSLLSRALDQLIKAPSLRQQLGQAGRNWVMTHMDIEQSLDQYAALYHEIARASTKKSVKTR